MIEDEQYAWNVSRYVPWNPVPRLVNHPAKWPWSSYPGCVDPARRVAPSSRGVDGSFCAELPGQNAPTGTIAAWRTIYAERMFAPAGIPARQRGQIQIAKDPSGHLSFFPHDRNPRQQHTAETA